MEKIEKYICGFIFLTWQQDLLSSFLKFILLHLTTCPYLTGVMIWGQITQMFKNSSV